MCATLGQAHLPSLGSCSGATPTLHDLSFRQPRSLIHGGYSGRSMFDRYPSTNPKSLSGISVQYKLMYNLYYITVQSKFDVYKLQSVQNHYPLTLSRLVQVDVLQVQSVWNHCPVPTWCTIRTKSLSRVSLMYNPYKSTIQCKLVEQISRNLL